MKRILIYAVAFLLPVATAHQAFAEIIVGNLSPEQAKEMGITMKHRKNGDAGVMVWLEFKKEGDREKFTCAELPVPEPKTDAAYCDIGS